MVNPLQSDPLRSSPFGTSLIISSETWFRSETKAIMREVVGMVVEADNASLGLRVAARYRPSLVLIGNVDDICREVLIMKLREILPPERCTIVIVPINETMFAHTAAHENCLPRLADKALYVYHLCILTLGMLEAFFVQHTINQTELGNNRLIGSGIFQYDSLINKAVIRGQVDHQITRRKLDLYRIMVQYENRWLSEEALCRLVYSSENYEYAVGDDRLDKLVQRLRKCFEKNTSNPQYLLKRDKGYMLLNLSE